MVYKLWLLYFLFVKKFYRKRWKDINSSSFALAFGCLFIISLFIIILLEYILKFNGLLYLLDKGLPLGPIAIFLGFIIILPIILVMNKKVIINKRLFLRLLLLKTEKINRIYSLAFVFFCFFLFLSTIFIVIINNLKSI